MNTTKLLHTLPSQPETSFGLIDPSSARCREWSPDCWRKFTYD